MNTKILQIVLSIGVAGVVTAAGLIGSTNELPKTETVAVNPAAKNYSNDAAGVRVVVDDVVVDSSVKSLTVTMKNTSGETLYEWSKKSDDELKPEYRTYTKNGIEFSEGYSQWAKGAFKKSDKVSVAFVVNGKTFKKNISLLGTDYKKIAVTEQGLNSSGKMQNTKATYLSYGDSMKWNISSKGINR